MGTFADKVAVVTGGASGIGRAVGAALAERNAKVVLADIDEARLQSAAEEIGATAKVVDVTDPRAVQELVDSAVAEHGRLDYMFNNAGIAMIIDVIDMSLDDWERILSVNLRSVIHGVHAAYPIMCKQGFGHIVNTASIAGVIPTPTVAGYCTTKHAVVGLSRALRAEARGNGVRVSVVCPGFVKTRIFDNAKYVSYEQEQVEQDLKFKMMAVDKCARKILRGVARNKREIIITPHARLLYWLQRHFPGLLSWITARETEKLRARVQAGAGANKSV